MSNYKEMNKEEINSLINDPKTTKNEIFQILCSVSDEIDQDDSYLLDLKKADLITQAHKILSYAEKFSLIENIQNEKTSLNTWDYRTMLLIAFLKSDKSKDVLCQTALGQNYWKIDCFLMFNIIGELEHDPSLNMDFDNALIDTILENRAAEKPPLSGIVDIKEYTAHVSSLFKYTTDSNWSYPSSGRAFMRHGIHVSLKGSSKNSILKGKLPYFIVRAAGKRELEDSCKKYLNWEIQKKSLYQTIEKNRKSIFAHIISQ
jgi:hypothetical protein